MNFEQFETAIEGLGDGEKNSASEVRNLLKNMLKSIFLPGDLKWVYCTPQELVTDYDSTGLGRGKRSGWAKCNGLNNTPPMGGRVPLCLDDSYPQMGGVGGVKDAVVVSHSHTTRWNMNTGSGPDIGSTLVAANHTVGATIVTDVVGESGKDKNMQPYIILLCLMKI